MYNVDKVCDFKNEGMSITILYIDSKDLAEVRKVLRQKKKQAKSFFESCPVIVDFSNLDTYDIQFIDEILKILKEETFLPVGVKSVKARYKTELLEKRIPVYANSTSEIKKDAIFKERSIPTSDVEAKSNESLKNIIQTKDVLLKNDSIREELTQNHFDPIRSGQKMLTRNKNLNIFESVKSDAEIAASGSILVSGGLYGRAAAGVDGDPSATIVALKFDPVLVAINGVYVLFEDGVPEEYKNKPVIVTLEDGNIKIRKLS
jgi:septum site-determining protein MinC